MYHITRMVMIIKIMLRHKTILFYIQAFHKLIKGIHHIKTYKKAKKSMHVFYRRWFSCCNCKLQFWYGLLLHCMYCSYIKSYPYSYYITCSHKNYPFQFQNSTLYANIKRKKYIAKLYAHTIQVRRQDNQPTMHHHYMYYCFCYHKSYFL